MEDYQPVSTAAVISVVFAFASLASFLTPIGLCLTLPSLVCAVGALVDGRRHPTAGRRLAICSVGICTWLLINVPITFYVAYTAESPAGYARLDFAEVSQRRLRLPWQAGLHQRLSRYGFVVQHACDRDGLIAGWESPGHTIRHRRSA